MILGYGQIDNVPQRRVAANMPSIEAAWAIAAADILQHDVCFHCASALELPARIGNGVPPPAYAILDPFDEKLLVQPAVPAPRSEIFHQTRVHSVAPRHVGVPGDHGCPNTLAVAEHDLVRQTGRNVCLVD